MQELRAKRSVGLECSDSALCQSPAGAANIMSTTGGAKVGKAAVLWVLLIGCWHRTKAFLFLLLNVVQRAGHHQSLWLSQSHGIKASSLVIQLY